MAWQLISGVNNFFADNLTLNVYPIPTKDKLFIKYSNPLHVDYIILTISNVLGQELYSERVDLNSNSINKELNVSNFQSGIYFLRISYDNIRQ